MPSVRRDFLSRRILRPRWLFWRLLAALLVRIVVSTRADGWIWLDEQWMILKAFPAIQVREACVEAPWKRPRSPLDPFRYDCSFWFRDVLWARLRMIELAPAVVIPVPRKSVQGGLYIYEVEYEWARLKSVDTEQLDAALQKAGIRVVRSTLESWLIAAFAAAILAVTLPGRIWRRLRSRR